MHVVHYRLDPCLAIIIRTLLFEQIFYDPKFASILSLLERHVLLVFTRDVVCGIIDIKSYHENQSEG